MKKCLLILIAIMLLCLCSCSISDYLPVYDTPETVNPYLEVVPDELTYSEGYEPVISSYAYDALPLEGEKQLYQKLHDVCYDISPQKDGEVDRYAMPQVELKGYPLTEAQVRTACKALTDDHPEIFWLTGTMGYYSGENTTVIQVYSSYSPEEIDARVNAVRAAANEFYATVPDGLSEFDREATVHDWLIDHVAYDDSVDMNDLDNNNPDIYTVYGALVNQTAVCEGYARAFQMLMNGLGVDCVGMMGSSQDQMHMWNAVKTDGVWYQTDVTWDDQEERYERHVYCNVSDAFMLEDHTLSPLYTDLSDSEINGEDGDYNSSVMNIFVPSCPDGTKSYYAQKAPRLTDFDGEQVKSGLYTAAENQEDCFVFYIDESLDYNGTVAQLFTEYPQYFFDYMNAVNNTLSEYSMDASNAGYYTHEKSRIVAVELHYY
ncbi:MAG: hypothetical protein IJG87_02895 [Ruminococcus sp.]|nr:hypothetical protein [Ruminococcus sp.]